MTDPSKKRVVVTGIGVVSSIGIGKDAFWKNLIAGTSGISEITSFDTSGYPTQFGGEIRDFEPQRFLNRRKIKIIGRASQLAIGATRIALFDAKLSADTLPTKKTNIYIGTTMGETQLMEEMDELWVTAGYEKVAYKSIVLYPSNNLSANVALECKTKGDNFVIPNACAAGNYAIGYGYDVLRAGRAEIVLAGGTDAFSKVAYTGFNRLYAMSPDVCRPFDKNREGMLLGEGAAILVLETLGHAKKRKAPIYAEILGYGLSCDAHHMTQPAEAGVRKCLRNALEEAKIDCEDVDYISAHGTGTPQNDRTETAAIKDVFGSRAKDIPVSSIKSMLGHTMGAAAAIEAAACCMSLTEGVLPPTINYETPDEECDLDYIPNKARKQKVSIILNNSCAFGGNNACVVLRRDF